MTSTVSLFSVVNIADLSVGFLFYYFNIIMLLIYRAIFSGKKHKQIFLFMACLHFFIVLAIRSSETGIDSWAQYPIVFIEANKLTFMDLISRWSWLKQMVLSSMGGESGYITLNWIFGTLLGLSYRTWLVFMSFLDAFCVYKYLRFNSDSPLLGAASFYVFTLPAYFSDTGDVWL